MILCVDGKTEEHMVQLGVLDKGEADNKNWNQLLLAGP